MTKIINEELTSIAPSGNFFHGLEPMVEVRKVKKEKVDVFTWLVIQKRGVFIVRVY